MRPWNLNTDLIPRELHEKIAEVERIGQLLYRFDHMADRCGGLGRAATSLRPAPARAPPQPEAAGSSS